ncbi:hypothetical protein COEREDRAFT_40029, partial [Coemansia reversa NRRL 1564]
NGESDHYQSIHKMLPEKLCSTIGKCVLMDPGHGDIFHCMHEMSTPMDPKVFRLSCKQCNKERRLGHFADVQEKVKKTYPGYCIHAAEKSLQNVCCSTVNPEKYEAYIKACLEVGSY